MTQLIPIVYVGRKQFAIDNVAGSRKIWNGKDDIQEVTAAQAKTLLKFPDQWSLLEPKDKTTVDANAGTTVQDADGDSVTVQDEDLAKPIEKMTKPELVAFAKVKLGKDLNPTLGKKTMIDQVEEWIREVGADVRA